MRLLVEGYKADIEARDGEGLTALHRAVIGGYVAVVRLLVEEYKADIEAKLWLYRLMLESSHGMLESSHGQLASSKRAGDSFPLRHGEPLNCNPVTLLAHRSSPPLSAISPIPACIMSATRLRPVTPSELNLLSYPVLKLRIVHLHTVQILHQSLPPLDPFPLQRRPQRARKFRIIPAYIQRP